MSFPSMKNINVDCSLAIGLTVGLHLLLGTMLLVNWGTQQPPIVQLNSIKIAMVAVAAPAPPAAKAMNAVPPTPAQEQTISKPTPVMQESPAEFARKRVEKKPDETPREHPAKQSAVDHAQRDEEMQRQTEQRESERLAEEQRQHELAAESARREAARQLASRQYLPLEKQAPTYPQRALDREIEGTCTVSYTVNTAGRVEQAQIAGECHPLFIRPSLEAAKGFRYEPRLVDGMAVAVHNVKNTFQYRIEQQSASSTH